MSMNVKIQKVQKVRCVLLVFLVTLSIATVCQPQEIRKPEPRDSCVLCPELDSVVCALNESYCRECWRTCGDNPLPPTPFQRVRPEGPHTDPYMESYLLPKKIGSTYVHGVTITPPWEWARNHKEVVEELRRQEIVNVKLWMDAHPFDGLPRPFCYDLFDTGEEDWYCESWQGGEPKHEDMIEFWRTAKFDTLFVRFRWWAQEEADGCEFMVTAPFYEIARELYRIIGWRKVTIVFTDWEQDWVGLGCSTADGSLPDMRDWGVVRNPDETRAEFRRRATEIRYRYLLYIIDQRQRDIERARKEAYLERGGYPNLRIAHSVILNRNPWNKRDHERGIATLAERLPTVQHQPDYTGYSYWTWNVDPNLVLDWYESTTGYPAYRTYIDEFGGLGRDIEREPDVFQSRDDALAERIETYVPEFWKRGIRLVFHWISWQNWCDQRGSDRGFFPQVQPCTDPIVFEPDPLSRTDDVIKALDRGW